MRPLEINHAISGEQADSDGLRRLSLLPLHLNNDNDNVIIDPHATDLGGDLKSAVLGIIKGMVGPAILYLPHGFANAGWMVAILVLFLSAALFLTSSACLLQSWKLLDSLNVRHVAIQMLSNVEDDDNDDNSQDFAADQQDTTTMPTTSPASIMRTTSSSSATPLSYLELARQAFGSTRETLIKIGIAAMQSGVCLTYLIFVPQNFQASIQSLMGQNVSTAFFLLFMLML